MYWHSRRAVGWYVLVMEAYELAMWKLCSLRQIPLGEANYGHNRYGTYQSSHIHVHIWHCFSTFLRFFGHGYIISACQVIGLQNIWLSGLSTLIIHLLTDDLKRRAMWRQLIVCFTIVTTVCSYSDTVCLPQSLLLLPENEQACSLFPNNDMSLTSVSRSVVKKVLAVETPEVWIYMLSRSATKADTWL